jgi:lipocalin
MVCEFLPPDYKRKLLEIAAIDDLMSSGFETKTGAYKAKEKGVISDDKCEKLVKVLGEKARPILLQALKEFASQVECEVKC